ncbi:MAG: xanthine dehydrogenase family protein molybdopterin-binding subunit, partial [Pseudomonadota bacterium]
MKHMSKFGLSQPVIRKEDARFLKGEGCYLDDIQVADAATGVFVRAPMAHARIVSIDADDAKAMEGVLGIWTGADLDKEIKNELGWAAVKNRDGSDGTGGRRPCLAVDRVRYVGECVALVVAETKAQAMDAAEAVFIDYEELPVVRDTDVALADGAAVLHEESPGNLAFDWGMGDEDATAKAFADAA